jgi:hypothetical protein
MVKDILFVKEEQIEWSENVRGKSLWHHDTKHTLKRITSIAVGSKEMSI